LALALGLVALQAAARAPRFHEASMSTVRRPWTFKMLAERGDRVETAGFGRFTTFVRGPTAESKIAFEQSSVRRRSVGVHYDHGSGRPWLMDGRVGFTVNQLFQPAL
jgi:hypothetical protein